ncbi:MAG: radical SAM protein [Clostridiales bacterium]|nr:radical SAM protein [Clostridiales bacterium]
MGCELCPRRCGAKRHEGEKGFCGADDRIRIARSALHFWEEPCISGKNGSGTVFFSGCTLKCVFCQNYRISTQNMGYEISVGELAEEFLRLEEEGANNINLVTPTHYVPQIISALDIAKERGMKLPVVYNSSGYERTDTIKALSGYVDVYLPDMKYFSDRYAEKYSCAPGYFKFASAALAEMYSQTGKPVFNENGIMTRGIIVRHLMLPSLLFDTKKIMDYLWETYGNNIYISLMSQYTPMKNAAEFEELTRKLNAKHYDAMVNYCMDRGMENVFIQDGSAADKEFIPEFYGKK